MRSVTITMLAFASATLACGGALRAQWASVAQSAEGDTTADTGGERGAGPSHASRRNGKPQRRAGTQPFRLRQPQNLRAGRFASQFRFEKNADDIGLFASGAYGVFDDLMISLQASTGHQYETVSWAREPGILFDAGIQYAPIDQPDFTFATRLDVVFSDESSFEVVPPQSEVSRVSFQPGILVNVAISDGLDLYVNNSVRLGDGVEPAFAGGVGLMAPLGKINVFLETDAIVQQRDGGKDILEAYLTPGVQFELRDKVDVSLSPSIGLSSTSYDWRLSLTMGVHF